MLKKRSLSMPLGWDVKHGRDDPERRFNDQLKEALRGLDPQRMENAVGPGTPDISYAAGWIESKFVRDLPKRATSIVRLDHYTPQQRAWHVRRRMARGRVHVAVRFGETGETFAFDALKAAQHLGVSWTADACRAEAEVYLKHWSADAFRRLLIDDRVLQCLT